MSEFDDDVVQLLRMLAEWIEAQRVAAQAWAVTQWQREYPAQA